ncbi:MAG TPA: putative metal-binding motif-containing protein, partial [Polyangiaceae bacterium]|nr:putative metal-binding motif-containing protein [Polyangiaceae bacterium]
MRLLGLACWVAGLCVVACSDATAPSPFDDLQAGSGGEAGAGAAPSTGGRLSTGGGPNEWGGVCQESAQCDDGLECTEDSCDAASGRCRFSPVDTRCDNDVFCDGIEQCLPGIGCRPGGSVACDDGTTCTIDRCIEETRSCEHLVRDADGDGDGVWNCAGGGDCDDTDPKVSSLTREVCANQRDDDCDGESDEGDCTTPAHDTCVDALVIEASGTYGLNLEGAGEDYGLSCARSVPARRDVVAAIRIPEGEAVDVDVAVLAADAELALAIAASCSRKGSELSCARAAALESQSFAARLWLRGFEPGVYPVFVSGASESPLELRVHYGEAKPAPENETCGAAASIESGARAVASLAEAARDVSGACAESYSELLYRFELESQSDVIASAWPLDDLGSPTLSLRRAACADETDELDCRVGSPARLFERALEPGEYFLAVGSTGPGDVELHFDVQPATAPEPGELCSEAPAITPGSTEIVEFAKGTSSVAVECLAGAVDTTRSLPLTETSDVLLVERLSSGDTGAVALLDRECRSRPAWACESGAESPVRARAFEVPAGEYRVVAESQRGSPV